MSDKVTQFLIRQCLPAKEFRHWGVLGMKWGVRKSRSRVTVPGQEKSAGAPKKQKKVDTTSVRKSNSFRSAPNNRKMTDAELRLKINRLDMEKRYKELTASPKGQSFVKNLLAEQGKSAARQLATRAVSVGLQLALEKAAGGATGGNKIFLEAMAASGKKKKK